MFGGGPARDSWSTYGGGSLILYNVLLSLSWRAQMDVIHYILLSSSWISDSPEMHTKEVLTHEQPSKWLHEKRFVDYRGPDLVESGAYLGLRTFVY